MSPIWQGLANPAGIEFGELPRLETQRLRVLRRLNEHKEGLSLDELEDLATVDELRSIHEAGLITKTQGNKRLLISEKGRTMLASIRRP
jgi:hypothetical protein